MSTGCHSAHSRVRSGRVKSGAAMLVIGALVAASTMAVPGVAHAEGLFDFLFGGQRDQWTPPSQTYEHPPPPAPRPTHVAPAPLGQENISEGSGSTGHGVAFCVRLCDGHHFPMEQRVANATPVETCRSMCPASKTKVFFGSEIDHAVAKDGARYTDLDTAYVYRKQLVAHCTCNGKD